MNYKDFKSIPYEGLEFIKNKNINSYELVTFIESLVEEYKDSINGVEMTLS